MTDLTILIITLFGIFFLPYIILFFVAMFCVEEMPTEERRPSSIKDCFRCIFFDGYTNTKYEEYYHFFVCGRAPLLGFMVTVIYGLFILFMYMLYGIYKLLLFIPGVKTVVAFISNTYNKIINYKFR